jgi:hypothetical protein
MRRNRVMVFIVLYLFSAGIVPVASAQDPLGGLALGLGLDNFAKQLQTLIDKAVGGGMILEIGAGGQISLAISQAKAAYEADLALTYDKLNSGERQTINSLSSLLSDVEKKTYKDVADLEGRALAISHSLPFSKSLPRMFSYEPTFAPQTSSANTVPVRFEGDFTDLVRRGLEPSAVINGNGKPIGSLAKNNSFMTFELPFQSLNSAPDKVVTNYLQVHVPYKEKCYLLLTCDRTAEFRVPITTLPSGAGVVTINYKTTKPGTDTRTFMSGEMRQESVDDDIKCGGEHADLAIHTVNPDPGYTLDPNTVTYHMNWSQGKEGRDGDWWLERNCSSPTTACLCFSTEHHRAGTSGKIHFTMSFRESKPINVSVPGSQSVTLKWGDNQVVEIPVGATWTGSFTRFDGKTVSFAGPFSDTYGTITQNANVINLRTIP